MIQIIAAPRAMDLHLRFARMIARGQVRGEIGLHVNAAPTAAALLASLIGLAVLARSRPDTALLNGVIDQAMASVRGQP